jgi:hypothetical protein
LRVAEATEPSSPRSGIIELLLDVRDIGGDSGIHFGEQKTEDALTILPVEVIQVYLLSIRGLLLLLLGIGHA